MLPILNGILWAFLRRWYGGFNPFPVQTRAFRIFDSRGLQSLVMMICFFAAVHDRAPFWLNLVNMLWVQFQFLEPFGRRDPGLRSEQFPDCGKL